MRPDSLHVIRHQTQQMTIVRSVELISHYCILGIEIRSRSDIHLENTRRRSIELHILHPTIRHCIESRCIVTEYSRLNAIFQKSSISLRTRSRNFLDLHHSRRIAIELRKIHTGIIRIVNLIRYILHQQRTRYFELPTRLNHTTIHDRRIISICRIKITAITNSNLTGCGTRPYIPNRVILPLYIRHHHMAILISCLYIDSIAQVYKLMSVHTVIERIRSHTQSTGTVELHFYVHLHIIVDSLTKQQITIHLTKSYVVILLVIIVITGRGSLVIRQSHVCTIALTE